MTNFEFRGGAKLEKNEHGANGINPAKADGENHDAVRGWGVPECSAREHEGRRVFRRIGGILLLEFLPLFAR